MGSLMKRLAFALALLLNHGLIADRAHAQTPPQDLTLTVNGGDLTLIGKALSKEPYGDVAALMAKLQAQVVEQQKAKAPQQPEAEKK